MNSTNGLGKHWTSIPRRSDLTNVLHRSVEPAHDSATSTKSRRTDSTGNGGARLTGPHLSGEVCGSEAAWAGELEIIADPSDSHSLSATERRPGQLQTSSPRALATAYRIGRANSRVGLVLGRRGCAGSSARPATHGRSNRRAGRAPDWKCHDTPDRRADASARYPAFHGASAGIRVPVSIAIVISPVIARVGEPVNMLITPVSGVPIGVVVGDRPFFPVGIHPMYPPA